MRTGACTVQQALTTEAASVLKHSLALAKRRGHAQVTPLHVAATLLSSAREPTTALFRRACLRSHPLHPNSHPLHCRALELCFNVALNRLPTNPPPPSAPLVPTHPTLSNALVAALKRAQAHQRRGCIEQQQQQQQQQQQPLLAIKVEVEQLIISILDDPSVSRVMREAGFSSTCVKNNLEDSSFSSTSSPFGSSSPSFFLDSQREVIMNHASFWQTHFLKRPVDHNPPPLSSSPNEDLRMIFEALLGKNRRRSNAVIVGDSVSCGEALVAELMCRAERGDVPEELRSAQFVKFHLPAVQLKFMCRGDVEMKVADLRRKVSSLASERKRVVVYLGDLKWAVAEEARDAGEYKAVDHVVAEVGRLHSEWRSCFSGGVGGGGGRVWLVATASYQTHMRCQMRQPSLEAQWGLQAVVVPSGGLDLSLQAPSPSDHQESSVKSLLQNPFQMLESKPFSNRDEHEMLVCCAECASNFEKEASTFKAGSAKNTSGGGGSSPSLPPWMQSQKHGHQEDALAELRRKWNRSCQTLHCSTSSQMVRIYPPFLSQSFGRKSYTDVCPLQPWRPTMASFDRASAFTGTRHSSGGNSSFLLQLGNGSLKEREDRKPLFPERIQNQEVRTALALSTTPLSDCATSKDQGRELKVDALVELSRKLVEKIPWQSDVVNSIAEALLDQKSGGKGTWLLIQGNDWMGKRRLPAVIAEFVGGSANSFLDIDGKKHDTEANSNRDRIMDALKNDKNRVVSIKDIDCAESGLLEFLSEGFKTGVLKDPSGSGVSIATAVFVLTTKSCDGLIKKDLKRKADSELPIKPKSPRTSEGSLDLDLNICADGEEEEEDNISSDLTHEVGYSEFPNRSNFLELIGNRFTLEIHQDRSHPMSKFNQALKDVGGSEGNGGVLSVDETAMEELVGASGSFSDGLSEKWMDEVFQTGCRQPKRAGR